MTHGELLGKIKARLEVAYGDRLKGVILYGSEQENTKRIHGEIK